MSQSVLKIAIVDDEALARERLRTFLASEPDVQIVLECPDGDDAVRALSETAVDVVFLDVQMPGRGGFEVLRDLGEDFRSAVVFVTAHDRHAVQAFEVHAVDYVLKPFDRMRLRSALARARARAGQPAVAAPGVQKLLSALPPSEGIADRIVVKSTGRVILVAVADVDWIGSADNYVELHVGPKTHLLRETMNSIASRLPAAQFSRISRTCIVNVRRVKELQPMFHGEYAVVLNDGTKLTLSRSYRSQLPRFGIQ